MVDTRISALEGTRCGHLRGVRRTHPDRTTGRGVTHGPHVERGNCRIHWQESGEGSPLLLIMGAVYSSEMWYPALPALSARHRVIRFDNRGTGGSTATREASISDMAQDALAVLDAAGVGIAHVYGVSLGGVVAQ